MLVNKFISKSQKFLCLGLSVMTVAAISLSTNQAEASPGTHFHVVTNIRDSGAGSLRQAVLDANANSGRLNYEVINFNLGPGTHTITLTSAPLNLATKHLTITNTGGNLLTVSGNNNLQVFNTVPFVNVTISDLIITGGNSKDYGGVVNITQLAFSGDTAAGSANVPGDNADVFGTFTLISPM